MHLFLRAFPPVVVAILLFAGAAQARTSFEPAQPLSPPSPGGTGFSDPALAEAPVGGALAAWVENDRSAGVAAIQARQIAADGSAGPVIDLAAERGSRLDAAVLGNGTAIVTWSTGGDIRVATLAPGGTVGPARTLGDGRTPVVEARGTRAVVAWVGEDGDRVEAVTFAADGGEAARDSLGWRRGTIATGVGVDLGPEPSLLFTSFGGRKPRSSVMRAKLRPGGALGKPRPVISRRRTPRLTHFRDLDVDRGAAAVARVARGRGTGAVIHLDTRSRPKATTIASTPERDELGRGFRYIDVDSHANGSAAVAWTVEGERNGRRVKWIEAATLRRMEATRWGVISARGVEAREPQIEAGAGGATVLWRSDRGAEWTTLPSGERGKVPRARTIRGTSGLVIRQPGLAALGADVFAAWSQNPGTGARPTIAGAVGRR